MRFVIFQRCAFPLLSMSFLCISFNQQAKVQDCSCIGTGNTTGEYFTKGECPQSCGIFVLYVIIAFVTTLITSTFVVPALNLGMRYKNLLICQFTVNFTHFSCLIIQ